MDRSRSLDMASGEPSTERLAACAELLAHGNAKDADAILFAYGADCARADVSVSRLVEACASVGADPKVALEAYVTEHQQVVEARAHERWLAAWKYRAVRRGHYVLVVPEHLSEAWFDLFDLRLDELEAQPPHDLVHLDIVVPEQTQTLGLDRVIDFVAVMRAREVRVDVRCEVPEARSSRVHQAFSARGLRLTLPRRWFW